MFRLATVVGAAVTGLSVVSAQVLNSKDVLTFNLTLRTDSGLINWYPLGSAQVDAGPGRPHWSESFTSSLDTDYNTQLKNTGYGTPFHWINTQNLDPSYTTAAGVMVAASAFYFNATFDPVNSPESATGGDSKLRLWADKGYGIESTDGRLRASTPSAIRYIDGLAKFVTNRVDFGLDKGYQGGAHLQLNDVTVTMNMVTKAPTFADVPATVNYFYDASADGFNPFFKCSSREEGLAGAVDSLPDGTKYYHIKLDLRNHPDAYCQATLPANTSFVMLNATTGPMYDGLNVKWDPELPTGMGNLTVANVTTLQKWVGYKVPVVVQPLDPRVQYTVRFGGSGLDTNQLISLNSLTTWSAIWNGQSPTFGNQVLPGPDTPSTAVKTSSSSTGAIVGGVIGGVVGAIAIAGLCIWLWMAHRRKQAHDYNHKNAHSSFEVDHENVTPYVNSHRSASMNSRGNVMSEVPSSPVHSRSRSRADTRTIDQDTESQIWSEDDLLSPTSAAALSQSGKSAAASSARSRPSMPRREVISERDAGTLEPIPDQVEYEYVPPQYNPDWARDSELGSEGPSSPLETPFSENGPRSPTSTHYSSTAAPFSPTSPWSP